jgi:hypothetical protein
MADNCPSLEQILPVPAERAQVEKEIEQFIEQHFEASPAALNALSVFKDPGNDANGRNLSQTAFKTWLQAFAGVPLNEARLNSDFPVPDLASRRNRPAILNQNEFYEIKPDSNNGRRDCGQKVIGVANFLHELRLTFEPGTDYQTVPNMEFTFNTQAGALEIEVKLKWRVAEPGHILYQVCIRAKKKQEVKDTVVEKDSLLFAIILIALAIALGILFGGARGGMRSPGFAPPITA